MGTTESVNLMAGLKFTLLGTELTAGFLKDDKGEHIFVYQDVSSTNEGITIEQLITDVKTLMGKSSGDEVSGLSSDEISKKLSPAVKSPLDIGAIRVVLHTVYLDIMNPKEGESTVEYAFRLDIKADGLIPKEVKLINVGSITLAVWNTTNEEVTKQLALRTTSSK